MFDITFFYDNKNLTLCFNHILKKMRTIFISALNAENFMKME